MRTERHAVNVWKAEFRSLCAACSPEAESPLTSTGIISPFGNLAPGSSLGGMSEECDDEALISVELDMISPGCPTNTSHETVYIGNVQFNNLDFIGSAPSL